jgi:hypothetical protein
VYKATEVSSKWVSSWCLNNSTSFHAVHTSTNRLYICRCSLPFWVRAKSKPAVLGMRKGRDK